MSEGFEEVAPQQSEFAQNFMKAVEDAQAQAPEQGTTEPEATEEPQAAPEEGQPQERARDEKGRFAPSQQPEEEPAEPQASQDDADAAAIQRVMEKFQNDPQKLAQAYRELERFNGQRGNEIAELRKAIEGIDQKLDEPEYDDLYDEPYVPSSRITELAEAGRFQEAAWLAAQSGDQFAYDKVMDDWADEAPRAANRFETQMMLDQQQRAYEQQFAQVQQPIQQQRTQDEFNRAFSELSQQYGQDFMEKASRFEEIAKGNPNLVASLATGDYGVKKATLDTLYKQAAYEAGFVQRQAQEQIDHQQAQAEQAQRVQATVASASTAAPHISQPPSAKEALEKFFAERQSRTGWSTVEDERGPWSG